MIVNLCGCGCDRVSSFPDLPQHVRGQQPGRPPALRQRGRQPALAGGRRHDGHADESAAAAAHEGRRRGRLPPAYLAAQLPAQRHALALHDAHPVTR